MITPDCTGCPVSTRRKFLSEVGITAATVLGALSIARSAGAMLPDALPIRSILAFDRQGALHSYPIPSTDSVQIDHQNDVILVRWQGAIYAFNLSCPHQNTALKWDDSAHDFQCPKHHSRFTASGDYIAHSGRATRAMDRLAIRRDGDNVVVDLDKLYQQDTDPAGWNAAVIKDP